MKQYFIFTLFCLSLLTSCVTTGKPVTQSKPATPSQNDYGYEQKAPAAPIDAYLTERVWSLAGLRIDDKYVGLDANMISGKLNFLSSGLFEATSGISIYSGTWKKGIKRSEFTYSFKIKLQSEKLVDESNTVGQQFDKAFAQNLAAVETAEIDTVSIRFYSKEGELLLHFVRM